MRIFHLLKRERQTPVRDENILILHFPSKFLALIQAEGYCCKVCPMMPILEVEPMRESVCDHANYKFSFLRNSFKIIGSHKFHCFKIFCERKECKITVVFLVLLVLMVLIAALTFYFVTQRNSSQIETVPRQGVGTELQNSGSRPRIWGCGLFQRLIRGPTLPTPAKDLPTFRSNQDQCFSFLLVVLR